MTSLVEDAANNFRNFIAKDITSKENINEAETRLLIIDEVLSILGWSKSEYNPEQPTAEASGYTDYRLSIDSQPRLIVEAKRKGRLQPISKPIRNSQYANSFLYNNCGPEMKSLLDQCKGYCTSCGLPYALATTGEIWIILLGFKHGAEWASLKALVFHSLNDVLSRFSDFYGLISREAVRNNSLEEKFGAMFITKPPVAIRPSESISHSPNIEQIPNRQTINTFFDYFMADITRPNQRKMLEHCYVSNHELNDFSRDLQQILRYDAALEDAEITSEEASQSSISKALEYQSFSNTPRTILLVGNIGAGKSTFVHRFIQNEVDANTNRSEQHVCALVDLINEATKNISLDHKEEQHIADLVLDQLIKQLKEKSEFEEKLDPYSSIVQRICFEDKLTRFRKQRQNLYQEDRKQYELEAEKYLFQLCEDNKYDHLIRYIRFIREKKHKIWVAFDNVDRGSYSYQQFIYGFAHRLTSEAHCVTLLTLRQDTYLEAQEAGFLDVRRTDIIFRLHAPEFRQVISKRRKYIDRMIEKNEIPRQFKENHQLINLLNTHLKYLVLEEDNSIRLLITTFSLNNVRHALAMLSDYYTSPHSAFHEFYLRYQNDLASNLAISFDYEVEQNRFLQALMLKNKWNYEEKKSDIFNLFSVDSLEKVSHFLMLRILAYLYLKLNSVTSKHSIKYGNIYNDFIFLGYQGRHVNNAVLRLISASIIISPNLSTEAEILDPLPQETKLILSPKGYYYLLHLASQSYYQTRIGEDTVWYNEQLAKHYTAYLEETADAQKPGTDDALQVTRARDIFVKYLRSSLLEEALDSNIRYTSKEWAQLMNNLVEEKVFGETITILSQTAPTENTTEQIKDMESALEEFYDNYQDYPVSKSKTGKTSPGQMLLFEEENISNQLPIDDNYDGYEASLQEAIASLGPLPKTPKTSERSYAIRILWCLEVAFRAGLGPLSPKEIAKTIRIYGNERIATTRISTFLWQQKNQDGEYKHLWLEEPEGHYSINSFGRDLLETEFEGRAPLSGEELKESRENELN